MEVADGSGLRIRCFGGFEVRVGGGEPDWSRVRPRVRALARYLALHAGRPVHRERAVAALWPDLPERAAINNFQVAVSTLRTFLEPGAPRGASRFVPRQGASYRLAVGGDGSCDVAAFDLALKTAREARIHRRHEATAIALRSALRHYQGELLPEDGTAEWIVPERARYRHRATEAAALLARIEFEAGRHRLAIAAARRAIDIDPFNDEGWRVLIGAQRRAGDVAAAGRSRHAYDQVLRALDAPAPALMVA